MKRLITLTSVAALSIAIAGAAAAQNGNGNGPGNGNGKGDRGSENRGPQARNDDRGGGNGNRGGPDRRAEVRVRDVQRQSGRDIERDVRRDIERRVEAGTGVAVFRRDADRGLLNGCPPGLAKRDNGCLPPGQARQLARAQDSYGRYDYLWRSFGRDGDYRYRDGYLYRMNDQGGLLGYLPVLGGVLSAGNAWPQQYQFQSAPQYVSQYYGLNDRYQYRYADGVLYGVDPQTSAISQVAALLTGQQFNVGQRLPAGYDVYNVPYDYRDRYADSATRQYRYNDGYVYQVDPTTQLVQAVIQLLV